MRHVSNEYRKTMEERTNFYPEARITFADGREVSVGIGELNLSGNSYIESAYSDSFPLGILVSKQINISLINDEDQWSEYDFYGAKIFLQTKYKLDSGAIETLNIGTFTVITPESYGSTVEFTAMDDGYKADKPYSTTLSFPVAVGVCLRDSCQTCGITLLTGTFANDNFVIQQAPTDLTHRQFIGMCAMIAGGNAKFDEYNRLVIMSYDFSYFERHGLDGGYFDGEIPYSSGDTADGGSFVPWNTGDTADGGTFGDRANIHVLYEFKSGMRLGVDDVVITGVQIVDEEKEVYLYGKEGYVLDLSNQLAVGKEDQVVQLIGQKIVGLRFRPFDVDHIAYPMAEFMDLAYIIDRKQNVYQTVITDVTFNYYGYTTLKCNADSPIRNSSTYYGSEAKAIVESRKLVQKEKTERERAVENLANALANSSGLYITSEIQPDKSTIYYMHDKPFLSDSKIVWKMTAQAFGISTDGGKTYPYGLDATGIAILNEIYAIGINVDYVNAGTMMADRIMGGTLTLGGLNNLYGVLIVKDSAGKTIGTWNNLGVILQGGVFSVEGALSNGQKVATQISNNLVYYVDDKIFFRQGSTVSGGNLAGYAEGTSGTYLAFGIIEDSGTFTNRYLINNGASSYEEPNLFYGAVRIVGNSLLFGTQYCSLGAGTWGNADAILVRNGGLYAYGDLGCSGTKYRVVETEHHGTIGMNSVESPEAYFEDIGSGTVGENGTITIFFDSVFSETIDINSEYQVFITRTSLKTTEWIEKHSGYFIVHGEAGATFDWMLICKQKNYSAIRMQSVYIAEENNIDEGGEVFA